MPNFKFIKRVSVFFVLAFVLFSHNASLAQERPGGSESSTKIEIKDVKIEKSGTEVKINGILFNPSKSIITPEVVPLLILRTIDPLIKSKNEIDSLPSLIVAADEGEDYFSLKPNEQKSFSYSLSVSPHIPQSNYYLYLGFIRSNGQTEADYEEVLENLGSSQKEAFLAFDQESCVLLNKEGKKFGNNAGPTFLPGESPEIRCMVKNIGNKELEVSPKILWKEVYVYGRPLDGKLAVENSSPKIFFKPGETKLVALPMPKADKPQVYQGLLSFEDSNGASRSFNMFFRWTISGESARIKSVSQISPLKNSYAKGEKIILSVDYFGSADLFWAGSDQNVSNLDNLAMKTVIKDGEGNVCGVKDEFLSGITSGAEKNKIIEISLDKKCQGASYGVSLSSDQKNLAEQLGELPKIVKERAISTYLYLGIPALLAVLLAFAFFRKRKIIPVSLLVFLFAGIMIIPGISLAEIKTYPDPDGGTAQSGKWLGSWTKSSGTAKMYSYINSENINVLQVFEAGGNFTDYYDNNDLIDVYVDYRAVDSSCENTAMTVQFEMFINAQGLSKKQVKFGKNGSNDLSYTKRFDYNNSSGIIEKWFNIRRSDMEDLYITSADGTVTARDNIELIIEIKQVGFHGSDYFRGYFGSVADLDKIVRTEPDAFSASDTIKIKIPFQIPNPSMSFTATPATVTPPNDNVSVKLDTTDLSTCNFNNNPTGTAFDDLTFDAPLDNGTKSQTKTVSRVWIPSISTADQESELTTICRRDIAGTTYTYSAAVDVTVKSPNYSVTIAESPFSDSGTSGYVNVDFIWPTVITYSGDKNETGTRSKITALAGAVKNILNRAEAFSRDSSKDLAVSASITCSSTSFPCLILAPEGATVILTAITDGVSSFSRWDLTPGVVCEDGGPTSNPCVFIMPAKNVVAGFELVSSSSSSSSSSPAPTADIKIRKNGTSAWSDSSITINSGESVDLSWTNTNSTSCSITSNDTSAPGGYSGSVSLESGTMTLSGLLSYKRYELSCTGPGGTATDSVSADIAGTPVIPSNLSASPACKAVNLEWDKDSNGEYTATNNGSTVVKYYVIKRDGSVIVSNLSSNINRASWSNNSYTDSSVTDFTKNYSYKIKACNDDDQCSDETNPKTSKANGSCGGSGDPDPIAVNGACGTATKTSWADAPTSNLCSAGTESAVGGGSGSSWTWTCAGSSTTASCSASYDPGVTNLTLNKTGSGTGNVKLYGWRATPLFTYDWNDYGDKVDDGFEDKEIKGLGKDWWYKMTATPDSGSYFSSWSGCSSTDLKGTTPLPEENACFLRMTGDRTVTVAFSSSDCCSDPVVKAYISAQSTTVTDGNNTIITWTSDYATSCNQVDSGLGSGSYKDTGWLSAGNTTSGTYTTANFSTGRPRTYTIECTNDSQTADASVTVSVGGSTDPGSINMWADPQSIGYRKTSAIKWLTSNVRQNSCLLYSGTVDTMGGSMTWYNVPPYSLPFNSGYYRSGVPLNNTIGKITDKISADTTYKMRCQGYDNNYVTGQTTVTVAPPVSDFTFTNPSGSSLLANIVEGLSANSSSVDLVLEGDTIGNINLSASIPAILSGAKAQFSADNGVTWADTLSVNLSSGYEEIKVKAINIPGATATGTYNVALTAKDVGVGGITKKLNVNLQVKKVSSEWEEF